MVRKNLRSERGRASASNNWGKRFWAGFNQNESGAFLLLGLVAVLIVLMMTLAMYDTGKATRTKIQTQAAADTAAYSASVVRARSLNQIAFANIAKRSVVGITAGYASTWHLFSGVYRVIRNVCNAYESPLGWIARNIPYVGAIVKIIGETACSLKKVWKPTYNGERRNWWRFLNDLYRSHKVDMKAIDNVQKYYAEVGPWWVWTEAAYRSSRNGALAASTFPSPQFDFPSILQFGQFSLDIAKRFLIGLEPTFYLEIPVEKRGEMLDALRAKSYMGDNILECLYKPLILSMPNESCFNVYYNANPVVTDPAAIPFAIAASPHFSFKSIPIPLLSDALDLIADALDLPRYEKGYNTVMRVFGEDAQPYEIKAEYKDKDTWNMMSSVMVLTYTSRKDISGKDRNRYNILPRNYKQRGLNKSYYDVSGHWNMSKSEIFFRPNGSIVRPDVWHTQWTARMRPMNIGNEWSANGDLAMSTVAMEAYPFMALSIALRNPFSFSEFSVSDARSLALAIKAMDAEAMGSLGK